MELNKISEQDLTTDEMLLLLNEMSIGLVIESDGKISSANQFFLELSGYFYEDLTDRPFSSIFNEDSAARISSIKEKIKNNLDNSQVVRTEDKQLKVMLLTSSGKEVKCNLSLILLSGRDGASEKWVFKLIDSSCMYHEDARIARMERLKDSLLNLNQSLAQLKDLKNFFGLVLEVADSTITHGEYCTILELVDDTFIPVAARGYSWNLMADFRLPLKESFSWLLLGHLIDRTLIIENIDELYKRSEKLIKVEGHEIGSSLQTPIFLDNELYGMMTIDSSRQHVFTEEDFNMIEYLRTQIQIALENQLLYNRIEHQASHDELTDVVSRGAFEEQVIKFLRTRHHYESCCIVMMDLNDLKIVNDVWGHSAGDRYLINFISVIQDHMRGRDLLARLGGDEFAICFFSSQSAQFIERLNEIQQHFIDEPLEFDGTKVSCYFSYGIAHCPEDGETYDVLINTADSGMYGMKADMKRKQLKNDLHEYRHH